MTQLNDVVVRFRWPIIAGFLLVTAGFASQIPSVEVDPEVKHMLPADLPSRVNLDAIEDLFGGTDMVMVVVGAEDVLSAGTLRRVRDLSRKIERVKQIDRVLSLFTLKEIRADSGDMVVEPAVLHIPETAAERESLRRQLRDNDLVYGNVVAKTFDATAIIALLQANAKDDVVLGGIDEAIAATPGPEEVTVAGMPFVRKNIGADIRGDMARFLPISLAIMLLFLLGAFRQLRGVVLPFVVVVMAILFSFGLLPLLGWKVQMITVLLPLILVAVANDYGIHLYARYQEENVPGNPADSKALARSVVAHLTRPVLVTGITTVGGLLCLLSHVIIPAQQLGILASAGVAYALAASLLFIPAVLSLLPKATPVAQAGASGEKLPLLERLLAKNAELVAKRPRTIVAVSIAVVVAVSLGILRINVDTNPVNYYGPEAPVAVASNLVNDKFGGSTAISVVAQGDIKDPAVLAEVDELQSRLEEDGRVGQTSSVASVVKRMNRAMHDDDPEEERLPASRDAVAQYFLMYSLSGDPEDFDRLVDFPFEHALLTARINTLSTTQISGVVDDVDAYLRDNPDAPFSVVGGFASVFSELVDAVVRGQLISMALSLLVIALLVALLFSSVTAGLLATVPLVMTVGLLFGMMGIFGYELNVPVALLSSIIIGVGVDYTIHFMWRYRAERQAGRLHVDGIRTTLVTTGRGIVFNALSVAIGFAAVLASSFMPVKTFGFLITFSIGFCLVGAMVLLPAIVLIVRPRFLEPR